MNQERNVNALLYHNLCLDEFPHFGTMMQDVEEQLNPAEHVRKLAPTNLIPHRLSVDRKSIFEDSVSLFKKSSFDFRSPVIVFENEPAVDGGGARREYFTLLLKSLVSPTNTVSIGEPM